VQIGAVQSALFCSGCCPWYAVICRLWHL